MRRVPNRTARPPTRPAPPLPARLQLEKLQQAVLDAGVPAAEFLPVVCDLTKEAEVAALPRIIQKRWPGAGIDLVVNNAGAAAAQAGQAPATPFAPLGVISRCQASR